jgi:hypothetical protein
MALGPIDARPLRGGRRVMTFAVILSSLVLAAVAYRIGRGHGEARAICYLEDDPTIARAVRNLTRPDQFSEEDMQFWTSRLDACVALIRERSK